MSSLAWLDNDRILVPAQEATTGLGTDGKEHTFVGSTFLYIWDTKTNTYSQYAALKPELHWFYCFNRGFIAYSVDGGLAGDAQMVIKAGELGHEKLLPSDIFWTDNPEMKRCHGWPVVERDSKPNVIKYLLAPDDGYIFVGEGDEQNNQVVKAHQNDQVKLFRPGHSKPVDLPILAKEMGWYADLSYSEFAHKYLLRPHMWRGGCIDCAQPSFLLDSAKPTSTMGWPPGEAKPIYLISPNGKVDQIDIPYGDWQAINAMFLTRKGLFWVSNQAPRGQSKQAGGWLMVEGKPVKLFDQMVTAAGVSPDGCKLAFQTNAFDPKTHEYLRAMDMCIRSTTK